MTEKGGLTGWIELWSTDPDSEATPKIYSIYTRCMRSVFPEFIRRRELSVFTFEWTRNCDSDWFLDFFIIVFSVENRSIKTSHGQQNELLLSAECPCIFSTNLMRFWIHVCEIYKIASSCSNLGNLIYYFELNPELHALCPMFS